MSEDFDNMVESGMTELEAYQALLKDVERMRVVLEKLPLTGREKAEEADRRERGKFYKWMKKLRGNVESIQWLLTIMLYFLISFTFGHWHLTWMIFLVATILQILIGSGGNKDS